MLSMRVGKKGRREEKGDRGRGGDRDRGGGELWSCFKFRLEQHASHNNTTQHSNGKKVGKSCILTRKAYAKDSSLVSCQSTSSPLLDLQF